MVMTTLTTTTTVMMVMIHTVLSPLKDNDNRSALCNTNNSALYQSSVYISYDCHNKYSYFFVVCLRRCQLQIHSL